MVLCIHYSTWCAYIYIPPSPHKPPCFCGHKATCLLTCLQTGFTWSLKVWEKWDKLFKDSKVWENWVGSVNFVVFRALGKNYQLICQKLHFSRLNSRLKKMLCKIIKNALPIIPCVGYSKGWALLPDVQNSWVPLYWFSAPYCRHHIRFCEKVNFERIFLYEPCTYPFHHRDHDWKHNYAHCSPSCDAQQLQLKITGLTLVTDTGHFWQLSCITDICSWISWLKTTYGHFLDTQIHTSNKRTFANTAQMMMKLCLEALNCSDCMMI